MSPPRLPADMILESNPRLRHSANLITEWVPKWQYAPRNQIQPESSYLPAVACDINELTFDARIFAPKDTPPQYTFTVAVPLAIQYSALALCATEEFFPEIKLNRKITYREAGVPLFVDFAYLREQEHIETLRRTDDERRYPIGDTLYELMVQLVALHEEGHYLCGHVGSDFGVSERGIYREFQSDIRTSSSSSLLDSRALELHADGFAAVVMLGPLFRRDSVAKYLGQMHSELARTPLGYMRFLALASAILALLIWQAEKHLRGLEESERTHPHPITRIVHFGAIVSTLATALLESKRDAKAWNKQLNTDFSAVANLFGLPNGIDVTPRLGTPWTAEWRETLDRLAELTPQLSDTASRAQRVVGVDEVGVTAVLDKLCALPSDYKTSWR